MTAGAINQCPHLGGARNRRQLACKGRAWAWSDRTAQPLQNRVCRNHRVSGMLGVTLFGLFLTPVFYVTLRKLSGKNLAATGSHSSMEEDSDVLEVTHA